MESVFWIPISFHADPDPDPGSQKCPYGFGSRHLIFYSDLYPDPDPKGVKIKDENLNCSGNEIHELAINP